MTTLLPPLLGALAAFLASWALVRAWIDVSPRLKLTDTPNARGAHAPATPRGGGVGIVMATIIGVAVAIVGGRAEEAANDAKWAGVLALFVAGISFVDDVRSLQSGVRLIFHLGAAITAALKLGVYPALTFPFSETVVLPSWAGMFLTVLWIVALINVTNFMSDVAGVQGVVAGIAWAWFGSESGETLVFWCGLTLAAASAGFLAHNLSPAKVFMGDVGSAFLGFAFAVLPLLALHGRSASDDNTLRAIGAVPVFAVLVVWPFLVDGVYTFIRRALKRESVLKSTPSHLCQRLMTAGWSQAPILLLYFGWAAGSSSLGIVYLFAGHEGRTALAAIALVSVVAVLVFVRREERRSARSMTKRGVPIGR